MSWFNAKISLYYENNKERLGRQARDKYRNLSEEQKNKKIEYGKNRYRNMSEEKKQRLKEYLIVFCLINIIIIFRNIFFITIHVFIVKELQH